MMDLPGDMPVTLVIKAPNQRMADQTVDCMLGWTIRKLKQHLETVYPSKPKHNEQRLIYSGRLLQDHLTLKEILRQYGDTEFSNKHTVHLVCSTLNVSASIPSSSSTSASSKNVNGNTATASTSLSDSGFRSQRDSASVSNQSDGLRHRGQNQTADGSSSTPVTSGPAYYYPQAGAAGEDMSTGYAGYNYSPEQYAWMMQQQQQMYSQYMMQYLQYYQSLYYPGQPFSPQLPPSPFLQQPLAGATLAPPQQQQQQAAQGQAAAAGNNGGGGGAGPARQNVRMNAQGGMEEDEDDDGEPRDWLHHTYFLMRFLTFMGILFFYSNLTRFLIVFLGSFAVYLLQKFRKYMQRAQREQEQQQQQNQAPPQQQEQNDQQQRQEQDQQQQPEQQDTQPNTRAAEDGSDGHPQGEVEREEGPQQQPPQEQEQDAGRLARAFIFFCNTVQMFFTSLLPTPPELLEGN